MKSATKTDITPGALTAIFLPSYFHNSGAGPGLDKVGMVVEVHGYKASVLVDGELETWNISVLKKMAAHKRAVLRRG